MRETPLKLLIVDHEPLARSALIRLCEHSDNVDVVGEAESGVAAIKAAEKLRPDVMLVDVQLPDMTGFDVLQVEPPETRPLGIMVTSQDIHADYALSAYEAGALDYLVKPIGADRFAQSIERARQYCDRRAMLPARAPKSRASWQPEQSAGVPIAATTLLIGEREHRFYPLIAETIDYIESNGNYVTLRTPNSKYISRDTIKRLSVELAGLGFVQIERSLLVNIRAVLYVESVGRGSFAFTLSSGACLQSSGSYRDAILKVLPMRRFSARRSSQ